MITKSKIKAIISCVPDKYRKKLLPFFGFSLSNVLLDLVSVAYLLPFLMLAIDTQSKFGNKYLQFLFQKEHLVLSITLLIVFFMAKNMVSILFINYQNRLIYAISSEISKKYTELFIHGNYLFYQDQDKGDIIKNTIEVPNNFANNVLLSLNTIISEGIIIVFVLGAGFFLFPKITTFALLLFIVAFLVFYAFRKLKKVQKSLSSDYRNNVNFLLDLINGFFEIKSAAQEDAFLDKFNSSNKKLNKTYAFLTTLKNSNAKYLEITIIIVLSFLVFYLVHNPDENSRNVLLVSFMASVFFKVIPSLNKLIIAGSSLKSYDYTIESILKNTATDAKSVSDTLKINFENQLEIDSLSFSYSAENKLISNINLQISKGEIIGITGRSGTGKTTLLHILLQLIDAESGTITLDARKITPENKNAYLNLIGYVTQEPYIFNGTILENIAIGQKESEIDFKRIETLTKAVFFDKIIQNSPEGIYSPTGNNGQKLSGGQKQKLAIIRALYTNPQILILDEATNQLDEENEIKILNYIQELSKKEKLTVILISHDTKTLGYCDTVYQLQKGSLHEV
ncbi:ATP-binding cassette domain-containing protein [Flavobacterium humi]|uniref:ABC transporter ATP-binding protein n=1 Tax=Flavobacterium humi TaxID=2562683 RepID=A0A4Z0L5P8_9FLAO|nr:ABC transporter ATP-binding protein [Flavobacterium humi]TGD57293.1 ABC transporter ATP-binding protein [Flavobacterium humi]